MEFLKPITITIQLAAISKYLQTIPFFYVPTRKSQAIDQK